MDRAKIACENSKERIENHFVEVNKMVGIGSNASRQVLDYELSRYTCYLIVQNGDPRKEVIALGQTYFAIQTRRQFDKPLFKVEPFNSFINKAYVVFKKDEKGCWIDTTGKIVPVP